MKRFLCIGFSILTLTFATHTWAACPTLSAVNLAYYLCPIVGATNILPQGFTAMVYSRPMQLSLGEICANIRGAAAKYFGKQNDYPGVETDVSNGRLVCSYALPDLWKEKAGLKEFAMEGAVENPAALPQTVCMPLKFSMLTSSMCHTNYRIGEGPEWTIKTKGVGENICSLAKGLVASVIGSTPAGTVYGTINENDFKPFTHTCTYTYHAGEEPRTMVLNGSLSLTALKAANAHVQNVVEHKQ